MSDTDARELRWWRDLNGRIAVNGDETQHLQPGSDLAGLMFLVTLVRDENLDIA